MLKKLNNNFMLDFFKTLQISGFPVKEARKEYQKITTKEKNLQKSYMMKLYL
jgi:hypothetical protein